MSRSTGFAPPIVRVTPIWFLVIATFVFRCERTSYRGMIGLAILVWPESSLRKSRTHAVDWLYQAIGSVLSRKWQMKVDPFVATSWEMIFAGLGHGVLCLLSAQYHRAVFNRRRVTAVLYLVVFGS